LKKAGGVCADPSCISIGDISALFSTVVLYFFSIDVFKTTPQGCDFTVPIWSPSRAKVACGHQKD
jgi:hypothetical protein